MFENTISVKKHFVMEMLMGKRQNPSKFRQCLKFSVVR